MGPNEDVIKVSCLIVAYNGKAYRKYETRRIAILGKIYCMNELKLNTNTGIYECHG